MAVEISADPPSQANIEAAQHLHSHKRRKAVELGRAYLVAFIGTVLGVAAGGFVASGSLPSTAQLNAATTQSQPTSAEINVARPAVESPTISDGALNLAATVSQPVLKSKNSKVTHLKSTARRSNPRIRPQYRLASAHRASTPRLLKAPNRRLGPSANPSAHPKLVVASYVHQRQLDTEDQSQVPPVETPTFAVTGDLRVVYFDINAKTIETNDGRMFSLDDGNLASVTSWEDNHFAVYYRCAQGGNCVLRGPGATTINARQI
jgi:hypothetical protein